MPDRELTKRVETEIPRLRRYARALTRDYDRAEDLVQDCLVRALAKLHLWKEGTDLRAWLFTILHNQYVNQVRRAVREGAAVSVSETEPSLIRKATQGRRLEIRDLDRALARLPEEQRAVILLVGLEGMRYEGVAERLGVPVGTVRSRLSRGREALRRSFEGTIHEGRYAALSARVDAALKEVATLPFDLLRWRWPATGAPTCPHCRVTNGISQNNCGKLTFKCHKCRVNFTVTGGTALERVHLEPEGLTRLVARLTANPGLDPKLLASEFKIGVDKAAGVAASWRVAPLGPGRDPLTGLPVTKRLVKPVEKPPAAAPEPKPKREPIIIGKPRAPAVAPNDWSGTARDDELILTLFPKFSKSLVSSQLSRRFSWKAIEARAGALGVRREV